MVEYLLLYWIITRIPVFAFPFLWVLGSRVEIEDTKQTPTEQKLLEDAKFLVWLFLGLCLPGIGEVLFIRQGICSGVAFIARQLVRVVLRKK